MIYSNEEVTKHLWSGEERNFDVSKRLLLQIQHIAGLYCKARFTAEAAEKIDHWNMNGKEPVPQHSKLQHYRTGRLVAMLKLALISAVARSGDAIIEVGDITRAMYWLFEAEKTMPDIFRAMIGKSDSQVIEEMHLFVTALWAKERQKPVPGGAIMRFLLQRVPSDKAERILMMAEEGEYSRPGSGNAGPLDAEASQ